MTQAEALRTSVAQSRRGAVAIGLCFLVAMLEGFDIQAVGLVGPKLAQSAHLGRDQLGFVFSMANVGLVIGAAIGGWVADRIGRKPVFLLSVLTFGGFTLATALASDYTSLLVVRVATGIGLGAAMPNMIAIASEVSRPGRRNATTAAIFAGMPLGGGISAIYIANLPADIDWRSIFLVGGFIPLLMAVLIFLLMQETRIARAPDAGEWKTGLAHALFGAGRAISTLLLWGTFFPTLMMLYILLNWLPSMVADKGLQPLDVVLAGIRIGISASFMFNIAGAVGALVLGPIVDRFGFRWPAIAGYVALLAALIGLSRAMHVEPVLLYASVAGFFLLGAQYAIYGVAASYYPDAVRGAGAGFCIAVGRVGAILGPILAGEMLVRGINANNTILALVPLALIAGSAVFALSFISRAK